MPEDTEARPVLETVAAMTAVALERSDLPPDMLVLVRLAALAAVGAPPVSYLTHVGSAVEAGITMDDVENVLVAVAPIVGTARVAAAGLSIAEALEFTIEVAEGETN